MAGGGSTAPAAAPSAATNRETQEIIQTTQSRKELYPDLNNPEDIENFKYSDFMKPLKAKPANMQKHHKKFFEGLTKLEKKMNKLALGGFSYNKAEAVARPAEKQLFSNYENQVNRITTTAIGAGTGLSVPPAPPQKEALFSAPTMQKFHDNMNNATLVSAKFSTDDGFRDSAGAIMRHILKYREDNKQTLQDETVYQYLDQVFAAKEDQIDKEIDDSTIISSALISDGVRESIRKGWHEHLSFRERMHDGLKIEKIVRTQKASVLSKPFAAARSGMRFIAKKIEGFRANWAGMDGKERMLAGTTIVLGLAWFLNTENENAAKFRGILGKAGVITLGALGLNAVAKVATGQSGEALASNFIEDQSGKRDMLKKSFDLDSEGARIMNNSIAYLGNYDFSELGQLYLEQQAKYKSYNIKDELKELPVGGVAENEMSSNQMFMAMRYLDTKLKKQNSSIEKVVMALDEMKAQAKADGKSFVMPTYSMIITGVLLNQKNIRLVEKDGKIQVVTSDREVKFTTSDKDYTRKWWLLVGGPSDWRAQISGEYPKESPNIDNLNGISSDVIPAGSNLGSYITSNKFGRYTKGFTNLYNNQIKTSLSKRVHHETTTGGIGYMTSKVPINPNLSSKNKAQVAAVKSAYENAVRNFESYLKSSNPALLRKIKPRIHEFIQPVGGVMIAPGYKGFTGQRVAKNKPQKYIMFLRYVLPNSPEFALRMKGEWPNGDMLNQMKENIMKSGDRLTRGDFNTFARDRRYKKGRKSIFHMPIFDGEDSKFAGAYESFLANYGIKKSDTDKADKVLTHYSRNFANSGITKLGLVRYLATHKPTDQELVDALGAAPAAHFGWIVGVVRSATDGALPMANLSASLNESQRMELNKDIFAKFGTTLVLACYGDQKALKAIEAVDTKLYKSIINTFKSANTTKAEFINGVMPHYLSGVFRMYKNAPRRKIAIEKLGDYLYTLG